MASRIKTGLVAWLFVLQIVAPARAQLSISNASLQATFNPASGQFSVTDAASQRTFVSQGNFLLGSSGSAAIAGVTNAALGVGQAIQITVPTFVSPHVFSHLVDRKLLFWRGRYWTPRG